MSAEIIQSNGPKRYIGLDLTGFDDVKRLGLRGASGDIVENTIFLCGGKNYNNRYIDDCISTDGTAWKKSVQLKIPR